MRPRFLLALRWIVIALTFGALITVVLTLLARVSAIAIAWTAGPSRGALLLPSPASITDSATLFASIDRFVLREMRAVRAPGLAFAIVHGDHVVHVRGFGIADPDGRPVTGETGFILGSLSKSFTALGIMQLAESQRLDLDAPVQRYLPWFHVRDPVLSGRITVRHLLNHTSGIPKSTGLLLVRGAEAATQAEQIRLLRGVRLRHPPGRAFEYSNANYWLLGLILEKVSGEPYEAYVRQRIFAPLGMTHSYTSEDEARMHGLAQGYRAWFGFPRAEEMPYYARELSVGYLISSVDDMARYLIAHLVVETPGGPTVVSPAGLAQLHTPPRGSPYAMGWLADTVVGVHVLWHTGAVANYHGDVLIVPQARWGIVLLTNVNNFLLEAQLSRTVKDVAAMLLGYEASRRSWLRYRATYWFITAAAAFWLVWRIYQFATLRFWRTFERRTWVSQSRRPPHPVMALVDPGLALGLLVGIPAFLGSPLSTLLWFIPDLTTWLVANAVVALMLAAARLIVILWPGTNAPE